MSGSREEERRKLADIINHWNANRLDLFEISQPTEVRERAARSGRGGRGAPGPLLGDKTADTPGLETLKVRLCGVGSVVTQSVYVSGAN